MNEIDSVASTLLEESKRFLEKAIETRDSVAEHAFLHASLSLGFSALEAHVNAVTDEQLERTDLSVHERAFLSEQKVELRAGQFLLMESLQMQRLDERLSFLWTRCSTAPPFDYQTQSWSRLREGLRLRNALTHPKQHVPLTVEVVSRCISAIIEIIDIVFMRIYGKPFPAMIRGLHSNLSF